MKSLYFVLLLTLIALPQSVLGACSSLYQKFYINEINTKANFVEVFASSSAPTGETITAKTCANVTIGKTTQVQCESHDFAIDGSTQWYVKPFSIINNKPDLDVTLYDSSGGIIDYIRIGRTPIQTFNTDYTSCSSIVSSLSTSHTFISNNVGQRDFYRYPDGSSIWQESNWHKNTAGATNGGGTPPPPAECSSWRYDIFHDYNPLATPSHRLFTRLVNAPFFVEISAECFSSGTLPARKITELYAVPLTISCPAATTGLTRLWSGSMDLNATNADIQINNLLSPKAFSNIQIMAVTDHGESICSEDSLAIRPSTYTLTSPAHIKAADFTLSALSDTGGGSYNGTALLNASVYPSNPDCPNQTALIKDSSGSNSNIPLSFSNDLNQSSLSAIDAGPIQINVKDSSWTQIDQPLGCVIGSSDNTLNADLKIGCNIEKNATMTITPDHFAVESVLSNQSNGIFTYLSNTLTDMSAQLSIDVIAQNSANEITRNYTSLCAANSTDYAIDFSTSSILPASALSVLNFFENNTSSSGTAAIDSGTFNLTTLPKTIFGSDSNGSASLLVKLNFDRNVSAPVNPFDLNVSHVFVNDSTYSEVNGSDMPDAKATFVYGRTRAYDIATDQTTVPNPIEIEVYAKASAHPFLNQKPQTLLYWHRNTDHDTNATGSVQSASAPDLTFNTSSAPLNGLHTIMITNPLGSAMTRTVNLEIPQWLWYSPSGTPYDGTGTDCSKHPCFEYRFIHNPSSADQLRQDTKGVNSGTFGGGDFSIPSSESTTNRGSKMFR